MNKIHVKWFAVPIMNVYCVFSYIPMKIYYNNKYKLDAD